ncbi:MAG: nicotinate phosphoribosyltransferase [Candidatus Velthaea sp.]
MIVSPGGAQTSVALDLFDAVDSYKIGGHFLQYPPGTQYVWSYLESRGGAFAFTRFFGLQELIRRYLLQPLTRERVEQIVPVMAAHGVPFNRAGFLAIVERHGGRLPVRIEAVPEGSDIPTGNVVLQVVNTDPAAFWLPSYLETLLMHVWYTTTVCTLSASARAAILAALERSCDDPFANIDFRLHDFGARGVSDMYAGARGGLAHLVNFLGTDTVPALCWARAYYHEAMAGFSIPAMEHATVTTWGRDGEAAAFRNMLERCGGPGKTIAMVIDSYDAEYAVDQIIGVELRDAILASGSTVVVRPDSGDPRVIVPALLQALAKRFGATTNRKGYRVLDPAVRLIQGDGMDLPAIRALFEVVLAAGFSAENVAVGMGGGLLQKVNRDTQRWAMKVSAVQIDGVWSDVYKDPKDDPDKRSKRGRLALVRTARGVETIRLEALGARENLLRPVYENGVLLVDESLAEIRARARQGDARPIE